MEGMEGMEAQKIARLFILDGSLLLGALKKKKWDVACQLMTYGSRLDRSSPFGWGTTELIFLSNKKKLIDMLMGTKKVLKDSNCISFVSVWDSLCSKESNKLLKSFLMQNQKEIKEANHFEVQKSKLVLDQLLVHAVYQNRQQAIRLLLEYGASALAVEPEGTSLLYMVTTKGAVNMMKILIQGDTLLKKNWKAYAKVTSNILSEADTNKTQIMRGLIALINFRPSVMSLNYGNSELLHEAIYQDLSQVVEAMIKRNINIEGRGYWTINTPLLIASEKKTSECGRLLIEAGANTYARDSGSGKLPLHIVVQRGNVSLLQSLCPAMSFRISHHSYRFQDNVGNTPLHLLFSANMTPEKRYEMGETLINKMNLGRFLRRLSRMRNKKCENVIATAFVEILMLRKEAKVKTEKQYDLLANADVCEKLVVKLGKLIAGQDILTTAIEGRGVESLRYKTVMDLAVEANSTDFVKLPQFQKINNKEWKLYSRKIYLKQSCSMYIWLILFIVVTILDVIAEREKFVLTQIEMAIIVLYGLMWIPTLYMISLEFWQINASRHIRKTLPRWCCCCRNKDIKIKNYFFELENFFDFALTLLFTVLSISRLLFLVYRKCASGFCSSFPEKLGYATLSIVAWFKVLLTLRKLDTIGPLMMIVQDMIKDVMIFLGMLLAVFLSFGQAFIYINCDNPFDVCDSLLGCTLYMVKAIFGDLSFADFFELESAPYEIKAANGVFFIFFMIICFIIMMNLLIAILNDTYMNRSVNSRAQWLLERARVILKLERIRKKKERKLKEEKEKLDNEFKNVQRKIKQNVEKCTQENQEESNKALNTIIHDTEDYGKSDEQLQSQQQLLQQIINKLDGIIDNSKQQE